MFPDMRPFRSMDHLLDDEFRWVAMQIKIDGGLRMCSKCRQFGYGKFCGVCGKRMIGCDLKWNECPECKADVPTQYCEFCGVMVVDIISEKLESGEWDFDMLAKKASSVLMQAAESNKILGQALGLSGGGHGNRPDVVDMINAGFGGE